MIRPSSRLLSLGGVEDSAGGAPSEFLCEPLLPSAGLATFVFVSPTKDMAILGKKALIIVQIFSIRIVWEIISHIRAENHEPVLGHTSYFYIWTN